MWQHPVIIPNKIENKSKILPQLVFSPVLLDYTRGVGHFLESHTRCSKLQESRHKSRISNTHHNKSQIANINHKSKS